MHCVSVKSAGYVTCESCFYRVEDILPDNEHTFVTGTNLLQGDIDSGIWAVSYLLSMYKSKNDSFTLFGTPEVVVDNNDISLNDFMSISCYLDKSYPLFSSDKPIHKIIKNGIKKNHLGYSTDYIRELFCIDKERFERPVSCVGNEVFQAMAAIGYVNNKQAFCFPWLSAVRFEYYRNHIDYLLDVLTSLNAIAILPVGK